MSAKCNETDQLRRTGRDRVQEAQERDVTGASLSGLDRIELLKVSNRIQKDGMTASLPQLSIETVGSQAVERVSVSDRIGSLQSRDAESPAQTFELRGLNHRAADHRTPDAVVRLPQNFDAGKPIHLAIYNHGFGSTASSAYAQNRLNEHMAAAPPNTVLIVPEWQVSPGSRSGAQGRLKEAGMFKGMLQEVFDKTPGLASRTLKDVDSISILAHSAGYGPTETQIYQNGLGGKVKSITLLDALYDGHGFDRWLHENIKDLGQGSKQFNNFFFGTAAASKEQAQRINRMLSEAGMPASSMVQDYKSGGRIMDAAQIADHSIVFKYSSATDGKSGGPHLSMPGLYVAQVERAAALKASGKPDVYVPPAPDRQEKQKPELPLPGEPGCKQQPEMHSVPADEPSKPEQGQRPIDESRKILENSQASMHQKLSACAALYDGLAKDASGRVRVTLNDGGKVREFEISQCSHAKDVRSIQVFARDEANNEHPVLRFVERRRQFEQQRDAQGARVAYEGKWWTEHERTSTIAASGTGFKPDSETPAPRKPDSSKVDRRLPGRADTVKPVPAKPEVQERPSKDISIPDLPRQLAADKSEAGRLSEAFASASVSGAGKLYTLKSAIARSRAGGRPLTVVQIGDSHVKRGVEPPALAARFASDTGLPARQISYSSVGDVGKTASYANQHSEEFLRNINRNTDLVVVSFGSNEAGNPVGNNYVKDYAGLIHKIRGKAPQAAIVMVGPTDGNYWNSPRHLPYLDAVAAAQESVASNVPDSTYIKVGPQMGSVAYMRSHGLMSADNLHLTDKGYNVLGSILAADISEVLRR
jgi:lysophospholipase L1-like esterase